jgi:hypothetical protein
MRESASANLCARVLGVSQSTVRRHTEPKPARHRQARVIDEQARQQVCGIIRATKGLSGAAGLARASGLPRRVCAVIKRCELRELERERKARCASVSVLAPGVIRGFDAMHLRVTEGKAFWLVAADSCIGYRTSITTVSRYDAANVIRSLEADFQLHGAPLVLRLDRAATQRTEELDLLLEHYQVLALYGPPRYPQYYGQLERQNREHRAWSATLEVLPMAELAIAADHMRTALNDVWLRPTLGWCSASQVWLQRKSVDVDRGELRHDVEQRVSGLMTAGVELLRARRVAIESALIERGLLTINHGRKC